MSWPVTYAEFPRPPAALSIHHVGNQTAAADFLQAANQELAIHNRTHHA